VAKRKRTNLIILHCSASDYRDQDADWIRKIHVKERGWLDIGYHFFIPFDGTIQAGRHVQDIGSHCYGHNQESVGICLAGLTRFTEPQFFSLGGLLKLMKSLYPTATLHGHREFNPGKSCPIFDYSDFVYAWRKPVSPKN